MSIIKYSKPSPIRSYAKVAIASLVLLILHTAVGRSVQRPVYSSRLTPHQFAYPHTQLPILSNFIRHRSPEQFSA